MLLGNCMVTGSCVNSTYVNFNNLMSIDITQNGVLGN